MSTTLYLTRTNDFREKKLIKYFIVVGVFVLAITTLIFFTKLINVFNLILISGGTLFFLVFLFLWTYDSLKPFVKSENHKIIINENEIILYINNEMIIPKSDLELLKISLVEFYYKLWNGFYYVELDGIKNSIEFTYNKKVYKYSFYIESRNEFIRTNNALIKLKKAGIISELNISDILRNKKYN